MQRISRAAGWAKIVGTGRIGTLMASYDELVKVFGEPEAGSPDGKLQAEWLVMGSGGVLAIYDYKAGIPVEDVRFWSIGGRRRTKAMRELEAMFAPGQVTWD